MKHSARDLLKKRYEDRDKGGNRLQALDFKGKDVTFWKPKEGKNYINILPYEIKTKNHPLVRSKDADVGDEDSAFDLWVHQFIGPAGSDVICPKKMFFKACPICEQGDKFRVDGKKDEANKCNPTHKVYYNIIDVKEPDKGVQLFQTSFKNFHKEMMDEAGDAGDNGEILDFIDFKNGKVVQFRAVEESFAGKKYFEFKSFKFQDREEPLDKSLKTDIISFDEHMVMHTYEELQKIFYGDDEDDSEDDEEEEEEPDEVEDDDEPVKQKKAKKVVEDEEEDEPASAKKAKKVVEDDDDDDEPPVKKPKKSAKVEEDDEEGPFEESVKKNTAKAIADEDEDSTLEAAKKAIKKQKVEEDDDNLCPYGHEYAVDCENTNDCDDCKKWADCYKAKKALKGKK